MKNIIFNLEIYDTRPEIVIFGAQEVLFDKYVADPTPENRELFLSSVEDEVAFGIGFAVRTFGESEYTDD